MRAGRLNAVAEMANTRAPAVSTSGPNVRTGTCSGTVALAAKPQSRSVPERTELSAECGRFRETRGHADAEPKELRKPDGKDGNAKELGQFGN